MKLAALFAGAAIAAGLALYKSGDNSSTDNATDTPAPDPLGDNPAPNMGASFDMVETVKNTAAGITAKVFGTKYDDLITASALQYGIPAGVLYKLLYQESHFREDIITGKTRSRVGALGIAQFMPATALEEMGSVDAAMDPAKAIPAAARYLSKLIAAAGSIEGGVAAYNWGIGNVKRKGLTNAPVETQNYVLAITGVNIA